MSAHEDFSRHEAPAGSSERSFGIVFTVVFAAIGAFQVWHGVLWGLAWFAAAALVLLVALVRPELLAPFNRLWYRFGLLLHKIVSPIILGILFFLVVTPTGLLQRALGKDLLRLKRDPGAASYWIERDTPGPLPETMKNQF